MHARASEPVRRLAVGLTGGIGSGKSAVAATLAGLGAAVVDADVVAHELTAPGGAAIAAIRAAFGPAMIDADGAMDRARMRAAVFADAAQRRALEAILHPRIGAALRQRAALLPGSYLVYVVPLLVEGLAGWRDRIDRIAVVDCPEALQMQRVMQRSGLSADQVRAIIATQATRAARRAAADDIIDNSADLDALRQSTLALHARYLQLASTHGI
jgi:dephospho-CoA kinase